MHIVRPPFFKGGGWEILSLKHNGELEKNLKRGVLLQKYLF